MKKVSEVAHELHITVPAVYKRIKRLKPGIDQFIQEVNGVRYISADGVNMLRGEAAPYSDPGEAPSEDEGHGQQIIDILSKQLEALQAQLAIKDQQIAAKDEQLRNMQVLLGQAQDSGRLLLEAQRRKPGLFTRLLMGKKQDKAEYIAD